MKNQLLWEQLRAPELKKLAEKNAVVMIPMGAVEQHGPHLPVATDTILAQWIAERAAKEMLDKSQFSNLTSVSWEERNLHSLNV